MLKRSVAARDCGCAKRLPECSKDPSRPHPNALRNAENASQQAGARVLFEDFRVADITAQRLDRSMA
jgi:hypothetical protein